MSKILIVDDSTDNIKVISSILKKNYELFSADNGEEGIKIARENKPDLILLDVMMPGMDGYEVCEKLKSFDDVKDIPIIFLTARAQIEDITKGFQLGGVDYVIKPFNISELTARIRTHIQLRTAVNDLKQRNEELRLINLEINNTANLSGARADYLSKRIENILTNKKSLTRQLNMAKELIPLIAVNDLANLKVVMHILKGSQSVIDSLVKDPDEEYFRILSSSIEPLQTAIADIDAAVRVLVSIGLIDRESISHISLNKTSFYEQLFKIYQTGKLSKEHFDRFIELAKFELESDGVVHTVEDEPESGVIMF